MTPANYQETLEAMESLERAVAVKTLRGPLREEILKSTRDLVHCGYADIEQRAKRLIRRMNPWWRFW
jgi:hypothetical protein